MGDGRHGLPLPGAHALVTGASRGIGAAIAEALAGRGARVSLVARSAGPLEALAARIGASAHPADLTDPAALRGVVGQAEEAFGPVDVLVNNAGVDAADPLPALDADALERLWRLNVVAPAELCRQVLPGMRERGRGHVVNVSSMAGVGTLPGMAAYGASKAALTHLTSGLRHDLRGSGVGTTLVEVGIVKPTEMATHVLEHPWSGPAFRRLYALRVMSDTGTDDLAGRVARAVESGRRHVRLPRRLAPFAMLAEAPRRLVEALMLGVRPGTRSGGAPG